MLSRLYRQRRRLIVVALSAMLAVALVPVPGPGPLPLGLIAAGLAAAVILSAPDLRRWSECAGLAAVLAGALIALTALPALVMLPATAALAYGLHAGLYGPLTARLPLRFAVFSARQHQVTRPAPAVWTALIPGASHPDDHWSRTLVDFDHDPDDPDTLYLRHRLAGGLMLDQSITFLERDDGASCRYYQETHDEAGHEDAIVSYTLTEVGLDACNIDSHMSQEDLTLGRALSRWFDDWLGDELDSFAALVEARRDWSISGVPRIGAATLEPEGS